MDGTTTPADTLVREVEAALGRRIERLEQENERLRKQTRGALLGLAAVLGVSLVGLAMAAMAAPGDVIEARRFVLHDAAGQERGELGVREDGAPELVLRDGDGRSRARLSVLQDGSAGLSFADGSGNSRAALALLPDQTTSLVFADRSGRTRAVFGYSPDDAITLVLADRRGVTKAGLGINGAGQASLTLLEEQAVQEPDPATEIEPVADAAATPAPVAVRSGAPPGPGGR